MLKKTLIGMMLLTFSSVASEVKEKSLASSMEIADIQTFLSNGKNYLMVDAKTKDGRTAGSIVIHDYRIQNGAKLTLRVWEDLTKKEKILWTHASISHQNWVYKIMVD